MANPAILHKPRLDTILMVEDQIQAAKSYPTKKELWQRLPRKVQYQTFNRILDYLESSSKILIDKGEIVWTFPTTRNYDDYCTQAKDYARPLAVSKSLLILLVGKERLQHNNNQSTPLTQHYRSSSLPLRGRVSTSLSPGACEHNMAAIAVGGFSSRLSRSL